MYDKLDETTLNDIYIIVYNYTNKTKQNYVIYLFFRINTYNIKMTEIKPKQKQ